MHVVMRSSTRFGGPGRPIRRWRGWTAGLIVSLGVIAVVASGGANAVRAQQSDAAAALAAQIDRIFKSPDFDAPRFGPARWLPDGAAYAVVERAEGGGSEIARYDAASGARSVLVTAAKLTPPGAKSALEIDDYEWSADGRRLLIFTNTKKVWRRNTRGDYWVLEVATGALKKMGGSAPESTLMFAKFPADGSRVAYVRANDIYVEQIDTGRITRLTRDGSQSSSRGISSST